jgi:very-short-patch-repair endonuclease
MTLADQLAAVPADRAVQLQGASVGAIALTLAESGLDLAPIVARRPIHRTTPGDFVGAALDELERVAVELLPAWLPEAANIDRPDLGGVAAIRMVAAAHAHRAHYSPELLTDLAVLAIAGEQDVRPQLPLRTRAVQLGRLVAEAFGRRQAVLLAEPADGLTAHDQDAIVAGAGWLAHNARMAVWLVGPLPVAEDQILRVRLHDIPRVHSHDAAVKLDAAVRLDAAERSVPPTGKPHPASSVEQSLEAALARQGWAGGRQWNQSYQPDPLSPPIRLDLLWPVERCVVELDGPEHCHPVHFEADRQRDVQLQLDGYAVLRFTNARVMHDVGAVVHQIGTYIRGRRHDLLEGNSPWPTTSPHPRMRS